MKRALLCAVIGLALSSRSVAAIISPASSASGGSGVSAVLSQPVFGALNDAQARQTWLPSLQGLSGWFETQSGKDFLKIDPSWQPIAQLRFDAPDSPEGIKALAIVSPMISRAPASLNESLRRLADAPGDKTARRKAFEHLGNSRRASAGSVAKSVREAVEIHLRRDFSGDLEALNEAISDLSGLSRILSQLSSYDPDVAAVLARVDQRRKEITDVRDRTIISQSAARWAALVGARPDTLAAGEGRAGRDFLVAAPALPETAAPERTIPAPAPMEPPRSFRSFTMKAFRLTGLLAALDLGFRFLFVRLGLPHNFHPIPPWRAALPVVIIAFAAGIYYALHKGVSSELRSVERGHPSQRVLAWLNRSFALIALLAVGNGVEAMMTGRVTNFIPLGHGFLGNLSDLLGMLGTVGLLFSMRLFDLVKKMFRQRRPITANFSLFYIPTAVFTLLVVFWDSFTRLPIYNNVAIYLGTYTAAVALLSWLANRLIRSINGTFHAPYRPDTRVAPPPPAPGIALRLRKTGAAILDSLGQASSPRMSEKDAERLAAHYLRHPPKLVVLNSGEALSNANEAAMAASMKSRGIPFVRVPAGTDSPALLHSLFESLEAGGAAPLQEDILLVGFGKSAAASLPRATFLTSKKERYAPNLYRLPGNSLERILR